MTGPRHCSTALVTTLLLAATGPLPAQQVGDVAFEPTVSPPAHAAGEGPVVLIDGAHHNFHTVDGRYRPFAELLRRDGYRVGGLGGPLSPEALAGADVLVIANALAEANVRDWSLPTPSAFTAAEIDAVETWVRQGGALLLVADHMPFPGAAEALAVRFGALLANGFAFPPERTAPIPFRRADGSLAEHPISRGRSPEERVAEVASFTGQAFRLRPGTDGEALLTLGDGVELLLPERAWEFSETTPRLSAAGMLQAAVIRHGAGRVAVFGEAAMLTAQEAGPERRPMGMNHPEAPDNDQLVVNLLRWLSGLLDAG